MKPDEIFGSRDVAASALADHIANILDAAIKERGNASLVVSGGTSPVATFHLLRRKKISWRDVTLVATDERLVAADHPDSNEGMIRRELMRDEAADANLLSLANSGLPDKEKLGTLNSHLANLARPLDIVILGMGDDGHAASLFPNTPNIANALNSSDYCVVQEPVHLAIPRITLTPKCMLDAREIVLLFFGDEKRAVFNSAIAGGDVVEMPVRFMLHQTTVPTSLYWAP